MGYTSKKVIFHLKLKFPTFCVGNSLQFFFPIRPSKSPQLGKFPTYRNTALIVVLLPPFQNLKADQLYKYNERTTAREGGAAATDDDRRGGPPPPPAVGCRGRQAG